MRVVPLAQGSFHPAVARSDCLVVEFSKRFDDFVDRAQRVQGADRVQWGHVDVQAEVPLAAMFGVADNAALVIFREQIVLYRQEGRHDPAQMGALIKSICALDMATIKAEIAERKQAELALQMRRVCPTVRLMSESHRDAG